MPIGLRVALSLLVLLLPIRSAYTQETPNQPQSGRIYLDVVVTPKSGPPVAGLQQQDFALSDNKVQQQIASFQALGGVGAPIEVILVVDAVNTSYIEVANERQQVERFLKENDGRLAYPTALAFFTDTGITIAKSFSSDGNAIASDLESSVVGLRDIRRSSGFFGDVERSQLSINALQSLLTEQGSRPGRKIVLWLSPGWPLLSGPGVLLDSKQQQVFAEVVRLSSQFRQARVTLYSIDPLGSADFGLRNFDYQEFVKGISKASQAQPGDLGLEVLAVQSGGLALSSSNDVAALLDKCLADTQAYYEISFDPVPGERRGEFHRLEIRVAKAGLTARTRGGFY